MATRFYLQNDAAAYTPATLRGAWDKTSDAVTKRLGERSPSTAATSVSSTETSTDDEYDVLLYRGVTRTLAAATIGTGTVTVMLPVQEPWTPDANLHYHLHIYVTEGDSDVVRCTLLEDYREAAGVNEWDAYFWVGYGRALNAAAALESNDVEDGDRIVVEIGYTARNTDATSYTGQLFYGAPDGKGDLVAGGPSTDVGYVEFSEDLDGEVAASRVTQVVTELLDAQTADLRVTQVVAETLHAQTAAIRTTQVVAEILRPNPMPCRITQVVAELLDAGMRRVRATQVLAEVLMKRSSYCGPPDISPAGLCGKPDVLAWLEWTVPMREP